VIDHLDHLVLTTSREAACIDFYTRVLGMQLVSFVGGTPPVERKAFKFGNQKLTSSPTLAKGHRLRAKEGDSY
jgi:catechol 2,3-dioxygenase-like lactoylglutathione lyase family enzyme